MRGKIVKVTYFKEQGLEVLLEKLRSQGWLELFTNTQMGCSQLELAEFYARMSVTEGTVTSEVNVVHIVFDASKLGKFWGFQQLVSTCMSGRTSPCLARQTYWT